MKTKTKTKQVMRRSFYRPIALALGKSESTVRNQLSGQVGASAEMLRYIHSTKLSVWPKIPAAEYPAGCKAIKRFLRSKKQVEAAK